MSCPKCTRIIPADAVYCIYCSAPVGEARPAPEHKPATGATIRLASVRPRAHSRAGQAQRPRTMAPRVGRQGRLPHVRKRSSDPSGGIFVVGLFVLLITGTFWPGILLLLALASHARAAARGRSWQPPMALVWFGGLAFLFWAKLFWPGILLLILLTHLLNKRKRAVFP